MVWFIWFWLLRKTWDYESYLIFLTFTTCKEGRKCFWFLQSLCAPYLQYLHACEMVIRIWNIEDSLIGFVARKEGKIIGSESICTFTTACKYTNLPKSEYVRGLGFGLFSVTSSSKSSSSSTTLASTSGCWLSRYLHSKSYVQLGTICDFNDVSHSGRHKDSNENIYWCKPRKNRHGHSKGARWDLT